MRVEWVAVAFQALKNSSTRKRRSLTISSFRFDLHCPLHTNNDSCPIASIDLARPLIYNISVLKPPSSASKAAARTSTPSRHPISAYCENPFPETELLETLRTHHDKRILEFHCESAVIWKSEGSLILEI
jgi:hypothetical protein